MPFSQDDLNKFKGLYIETARQYLENMLIHIASLMTEQTEESLYGMRIAAHSLTGQSKVAGYEQIGNLSSMIEQIFTDRTEASPAFSIEKLQQIKVGIEKMLKSVEEIEKGGEEVDLSEEIKNLKL